MGVVKLADYRPQLEVVEHRVADTVLQVLKRGLWLRWAVLKTP